MTARWSSASARGRSLALGFSAACLDGEPVAGTSPARRPGSWPAVSAAASHRRRSRPAAGPASAAASADRPATSLPADDPGIAGSGGSIGGEACGSGSSAADQRLSAVHDVGPGLFCWQSQASSHYQCIFRAYSERVCIITPPGRTHHSTYQKQRPNDPKPVVRRPAYGRPVRKSGPATSKKQ